MIMSKTITRKTGSGGNNKKRSKTFIKTLKSKIQKEPTKSMPKMARELKVDSKIVRNPVKYDLKVKSYTRTPKHLLTTVIKEKRLERCKKITTWLKKNPSIVMIFSVEKIFPVDAVLNRRNHIAQSQQLRLKEHLEQNILLRLWLLAL